MNKKSDLKEAKNAGSDNPRLDRQAIHLDIIERISLILGIFKSLQILLPAPHLADAWLSSPNDSSVFNGAPPKSLLLSGAIDDLAAVRNFLSYEENQ